MQGQGASLSYFRHPQHAGLLREYEAAQVEEWDAPAPRLKGEALQHGVRADIVARTRYKPTGKDKKKRTRARKKVAAQKRSWMAQENSVAAARLARMTGSKAAKKLAKKGGAKAGLKLGAKIVGKKIIPGANAIFMVVDGTPVAFHSIGDLARHFGTSVPEMVRLLATGHFGAAGKQYLSMNWEAVKLTLSGTARTALAALLDPSMADLIPRARRNRKLPKLSKAQVRAIRELAVAVVAQFGEKTWKKLVKMPVQEREEWLVRNVAHLRRGSSLGVSWAMEYIPVVGPAGLRAERAVLRQIALAMEDKQVREAAEAAGGAAAETAAPRRGKKRKKAKNNPEMAFNEYISLRERPGTLLFPPLLTLQSMEHGPLARMARSEHPLAWAAQHELHYRVRKEDRERHGPRAAANPSFYNPHGGIMPARDPFTGRFLARRNMAGRPGKHGLPTIPVMDVEFAQFSIKVLQSKAKTKKWGKRAKAELARRKASRALRADIPSPHKRAAKRKEAPAYHGGLAPGFSLKKGTVKGSDVWHLHFQGANIGKYAMTPERAAILSHKIDPATGKKRKPAWMAKSNQGFRGWDW